MPSITSITPATFDAGRSVTLSGSGFGASQGSVLIGGVAQNVNTWSDTSITFTTVRGSQSLGACRVDVVAGIPNFTDDFESYADVIAAVSGPWDSQDTANGGTNTITTFGGSKRYTCTWVANESRTLLYYRFPGAVNGDVSTGKSYLKLQWDEYRDSAWDFQADKSCRMVGRQSNNNVTLDLLLGLEGSGTPGNSTRAVVFGQGLGTNSNFVIDSDWNMVREQWYTIAVEIQLNTIGNADGWIKLWRDGVLMGSAASINVRGSNNDYTFHQVAVGGWESGGTPAASETRYIDNVQIWWA